MSFYGKTHPASARAAPLAAALFENCCERKTLLNVGGEVLYKFCGQVSYYEMVNDFSHHNVGNYY